MPSSEAMPSQVQRMRPSKSISTWSEFEFVVLYSHTPFQVTAMRSASCFQEI
jgi:hypothetical protein